VSLATVWQAGFLEADSRGIFTIYGNGKADMFWSKLVRAFGGNGHGQWDGLE
jgi:hypothetical protein